MAVNILLLILKILGIIVLSVLGLVFLVLFLVLVVPVRYKICGYSDEKMELDIKFSYLLYFFKGIFSITKDKKVFKMSIFWGLINIPEKKKKPDYTKDFYEEGNQDEKDEDETDDEEDYKEDSFESDEESSDEYDSEDEDLFLPETMREKKKPKKESKKKSKKKKSFSDFKNMWLDERNKEGIKYVLSQVGYILKKYLPRKAKGNLYFGTNDPATTGEIIGALSVIPLMYQRGLHIHPDFETENFYIRGELFAIGFVQLGVLLVVLIRLLINKNSRNLIKSFLEK